MVAVVVAHGDRRDMGMKIGWYIVVVVVGRVRAGRGWGDRVCGFRQFRHHLEPKSVLWVWGGLGWLGQKILEYKLEGNFLRCGFQGADMGLTRADTGLTRG